MNIRFFALSGALVLLPLVGCNSNSGSTTDAGNTPATDTSANSASTAPAGGKTYELAFVTNNASDYWTVASKGVQKADDELPNVTVEIKLPGKGTAAEQTQLVNDLVSKGVKGIAISPVDPANQTDFLNGVAAKALVFTQDSDAPKSKRTCYIGTDNVAAGRQAGELLKKALPKGGNVMVFVGNKDAQNAADRYKGLAEAVAGSNIKILDVRTDGADHAKAKSNVSDALVKYPDLAGCVGLWSYNGPAIVSAVKDAGKIGKVQIVTFDEEDDTLAGVKSGAIYATVVQNPYEFGYSSIKKMAAYIDGDKSVVPASGTIIVPTRAITQDKVDAFKANLDKLRGR